MIPWLYLKGISTGDFQEALSSLLGADAGGLSATTITRFKEGWQSEYNGDSKFRFGERGTVTKGKIGLKKRHAYLSKGFAATREDR